MGDTLRCPDPARLRQLLATGSFDGEIENVLEWLATHLENRNLYHKKQNLKNRILREKMKELNLSDEVEKLTNDAVFNTVADQDPDWDLPSEHGVEKIV